MVLWQIDRLQSRPARSALNALAVLRRPTGTHRSTSPAAYFWQALSKSFWTKRRIDPDATQLGRVPVRLAAMGCPSVSIIPQPLLQLHGEQGSWTLEGDFNSVTSNMVTRADLIAKLRLPILDVPFKTSGRDGSKSKDREDTHVLGKVSWLDVDDIVIWEGTNFSMTIHGRTCRDGIHRYVVGGRSRAGARVTSR
jgi:hypothetical protein